MENFNKDFLTRMQGLCKNNYNKFIESLKLPAIAGLRSNTILIKTDRIKKEFPNFIKPTEFYSEGFYINGPKKRLTCHPFHHAGAFYVQEPSAMVAVIILSPKPDEKVLDLCASPGGKSTQIAAMMDNTGILVCNEYNKKRVSSLISNIERMGVENALVYSRHPDRLCKQFEFYFDKILVDAPCSGESMFRKNENAKKQWSKKKSNGCALKQSKILNSAAIALKGGGELVYSTCTFSREENEEIIENFLKTHSEFNLENAYIDFGCESEINDKNYGRRIYPYHGGEGAFIAKLKKKGDGQQKLKNIDNFIRDKNIDEFLQETIEEKFENIVKIKNKVYIIPKNTPNQEGVLRVGVYMGETKKDRFIPAHHMFKCNLKFKPEKTINLNVCDKEVQDFLHGDILKTQNSGYCSIKVGGVPLGFGRANGEILKNYYPKGLRIY